MKVTGGETGQTDCVKCNSLCQLHTQQHYKQDTRGDPMIQADTAQCFLFYFGESNEGKPCQNELIVVLTMVSVDTFKK